MINGWRAVIVIGGSEYDRWCRISKSREVKEEEGKEI